MHPTIAPAWSAPSGRAPSGSFARSTGGPPARGDALVSDRAFPTPYAEALLPRRRYRGGHHRSRGGGGGLSRSSRSRRATGPRMPSSPLATISADPLGAIRSPSPFSTCRLRRRRRRAARTCSAAIGPSSPASSQPADIHRVTRGHVTCAVAPEPGRAVRRAAALDTAGLTRAHRVHAPSSGLPRDPTASIDRQHLVPCGQFPPAASP